MHLCKVLKWMRDRDDPSEMSWVYTQKNVDF